MAKRQGGELNHENWNAEEVPEEAGQFRQAGQAALAGRVIKTARRRRPVGGEEGEAAPKSAFAGFGGFAKPVSTDATAAFSFIGKSNAEASSPPSGGFAAFGSAASPTGGAFSFGSTASKVNFSQSVTESEPPAPKKSSVFGNFGATEEQKSTFDTTTSEPKSSGFGAFSFGAKKTEDKPPPQTQSVEASKSDLMSMFKPAGWACDTCMVSNPTDKTACLACEAPKPGSKPVEKQASSSAFSFGAVTSTASTGGFSFGAPSTKVEENKENNSGSGFSFGSKNSGSEKANLGGFQFGSKPAGDDNPPVTKNGGFSFGAKSSNEDTTKPASTGGFSFGAKTSTEDPPKKAEVGSFSFGEKSSGDLASSKPAAPSFSFGAKPAESAPTESFSFGNAFGSKPVEAKAPEKASSSSEFSFGPKKSAETGSPKTTVAPAPLGSFAFGSAPMDKKSDDVLEKKTSAPSNIGSSSSENPSGFSFGATKVSEKTSSSSATSFGNSNSVNLVTQVDETSGSGSSGAGSPTRTPPSKEYLAHLKALNMQVASWINKHLEQNPLVLLTPVFKDYEKHLSEITGKYKGEAAPNTEVKASFPLITDVSSSAAGPPITSSTTSVPAFSPTVKSSEVSKPQPAFGGFGAASTDKPKPTSAAAPFSFGLSTGNNSPVPSSLPAFGAFGSSSVASTTASSGFSFGNLASAPPPAASAEAAGDEDEDAPPVVEIKQVTEDDAKYSKKCKLFFKKDGSYVEKGVGMLYIKPVEGEKHQLLIRADTNLGNVLLNILLSSQIPTTRVGKNNVMLVCVPNPPVDPKQAEPATPCPMLIRVKDGEAADELKAKIEECSGK